MPNEMQFMDCPYCGRRVRTTAERCHRCGQVPAVAVNRTIDSERSADPDKESDPEGSQSHHAASWGGHSADDDDFDYEEFVHDEFGHHPLRRRRPWWWYVAWVVLAVFAMGIAIDALVLVVR